VRLQKRLLVPGPFERADITSNTFGTGRSTIWQVYGSMDEVFKFAETFKEFPPRSFPPSFSAATIMEEVLDEIKDVRKRAAEKANRRTTIPVVRRNRLRWRHAARAI